jgi:putative tryptophan/tyrosine transport system substrate-binding protein
LTHFESRQYFIRQTKDVFQMAGLNSYNDAPLIRGTDMRRRDFITVIGGAASAWPLVARAQHVKPPRIGMLMGLSPSDKESQLRIKAFKSAWPEVGWIEGRNIQVDFRWASGDVALMRSHASELVASAPQVIVAEGTSVLSALREVTQSIPIVFFGVSDPEGAGIVKNLARPGGNMTGFANFEPAMGGKWLQILKEIAPRLTRVAVLRNPAALMRIRRSIETEAISMGIEVVDCGVGSTDEIAASIRAFAGQLNAGLIALPDPIVVANRLLIIELAEKQRHPAIYPFRSFAIDGGLLSYGVDVQDQARRSAFYVDRILKGATPGDLPVQAPTKFQLVMNLKTAKALNLMVPATLLARADEVIE